jgi:glycosyltransferase involved in cell wall biosynthesis
MSIVFLFPGHVLTDHLANGDGLIAFGFISALAKRGHRIHVLAQRVDVQEPFPPNVSIHLIAADAAGSAVGRLAFIVRSGAVIRRLLRRERIDLVHQLNPVNNGMSAGAYGLKIPLILGTFVAKWPEEQPARSISSRVVALLRDGVKASICRLQESQAAGFLVTTPAALSRFSSQPAVADRVHWLPHGIDVSHFAPRSAAVGSEQTILYLTSVARKKGIFTLLDAFALVREKVPGAKLVIAGHGPHFTQMCTYVEGLPSREHITVLGSVTRAIVPQLMADCAVYCLPSFGEPYATTVIEAMACAKPLVVSDSGGVPHMVDDVGARLVKTGNVTDLANALIDVLRSPSLQRHMGAHNRARAMREYDWPNVVEELERIYKKVLERSVIKMTASR